MESQQNNSSRGYIDLILIVEIMILNSLNSDSYHLSKDQIEENEEEPLLP